MIDIKVSLNLTLQGRVMLSSQECDKNPKQNYDIHKLFVQKTDNPKDGMELITYRTRRYNTAKQSINMNSETYDYMLDTPTTPKLAKIVWSNPSGTKTKRAWDFLSKEDRLKHHFDQIAQDLHAISYTYEVIED